MDNGENSRMLTIEEVNALLGINVDHATLGEVSARTFEFCLEMIDCYKEHTLESDVFKLLLWYFLLLDAVLDDIESLDDDEDVPNGD